VYIGTIFVLTWVFGGKGAYISFYSLFLGGIMLGAFFMATDYTTSPMTFKGQILFAIGAGIIAAVIRLFGGYPEGVSYSLLLMNLAVPLIDKFVKVKRFGGGKTA
jgi:electron transport complex protein RnfD